MYKIYNKIINCTAKKYDDKVQKMHVRVAASQLLAVEGNTDGRAILTGF